jgi:hypothetical protein
VSAISVEINVDVEMPILYLVNTLPTTRLPATKLTSMAILGNACDNPKAALVPDPLLVVPSWLPIPIWPFDVARTDGSTVTVCCVLVCMEVEKVCSPPLSAPLRASSLRKTRAKEGAGTLTWQEPPTQVTVWMSSWPISLPSESKLPPKV